MLVTFRTDVHADILMFGDIAVQLLKLMGHSGAVPGALLADDVPAALERLRQAVAAQPATIPSKRIGSTTTMTIRTTNANPRSPWRIGPCR